MGTMPRKKNKARRVFQGKNIKAKPKPKMCWVEDDGIRRGKIVAAAEYIK
jgi:hypothetical protein